MSTGEITLNRRRFIKRSATAALASGLFGSPLLGSRPVRAARRLSANEKLNIGIIGAGGKGGENLKGVSSENIVAICDVDEKRAAEAYQRYPNTKKYQDFREMLDKEKNLDAVVVTTPDHIHAPASVMAMKLGKHVYCEKPLTHSVAEARIMRETAERYQVATQMGNQGHSFDSTRKAVEWIRAGVIGTVSEVHVWSDRPIWPQGLDRPVDRPPAPSHLNWQLWLGPARARPYHPSYLPFNWRGWWDFGTGALGDMACHCADTAFWALELGYPTAIEAESDGVTAESPPKWSIIRYQFPARKEWPALRLTWYDGGKKPHQDLAPEQTLPPNGSLIIGSKGTMFLRDWNADKFLLLPEERFKEYQGPQPFLPRSPGHYQEWIAACKGGPAAASHFDYAAVLTETVLLGNVALRTGQKIDWDAQAMKARNCPAADPFIRREYRPGWSL